MKNAMKTWLAAAVAAVTLTSIADAATYSFSFNNEDGAVAGTVSGLIELPDGDGLSLAATSVLVTSTPAALGYTLPQDYLSASFSTVFGNSFDVAGGTIVDATFASTDGVNGIAISFPFGRVQSSVLNLNGNPNFNFGTVDNNSSTLTFAPVAAAIPLPAGAVLMVTGLAGLGLWRRRAA